MENQNEDKKRSRQSNDDSFQGGNQEGNPPLKKRFEWLLFFMAYPQ